MTPEATVEVLARRMLPHAGAGVELEDLLAWGHVGLAEAQRTYQAGRGAAFTTYLWHRVRGAMLDGLRRWRGLEQPVADEAELDGPALGVLPDEALGEAQVAQRVRAALGSLRPRHRKLVEAYYLEGLTMEVAAARIGLSKSWACRILQDSVAILRTEVAP